MTPEEATLRRIRRRSILFGALLAAAAFLVSWQAGLSLTICAGVVIFSFLVYERLTERLVVQPKRKGSRSTLLLVLVTGVAVALLVVVLRWKAFEPIPGVLGLSAVVLAIVAEIFERGREG